MHSPVMLNGEVFSVMCILLFSANCSDISEIWVPEPGRFESGQFDSDLVCMYVLFLCIGGSRVIQVENVAGVALAATTRAVFQHIED